MSSTNLLGLLLLLAASTIFTYYTIWALFLPFLPASSPLHACFPAREWAVRIPVALLLAGIAAIGGFVGLVLVKEGKKKRAQATAAKSK